MLSLGIGSEYRKTWLAARACGRSAVEVVVYSYVVVPCTYLKCRGVVEIWRRGGGAVGEGYSFVARLSYFDRLTMHPFRDKAPVLLLLETHIQPFGPHYVFAMYYRRAGEGGGHC